MASIEVDRCLRSSLLTDEEDQRFCWCPADVAPFADLDGLC